MTIDTTSLPASSAQAVEQAWSGAISQAGDPLPKTHLTVKVNAEVPLPQALSSLSQEVTLAAIEARRGELWMLHAAGVADEQGRTLVLIAPSGTGKTTAARTLGTEFSYVSDETVAITPDGEVLAYRKPLSVIEQSDAAKSQRSPAELGLKQLPENPLRVAALILLDRDPQHDPTTATLTPCDLGEVLPELVAQTSYIGDLPHALRTIAALTDATGGVHKVTYSEASTLAATLKPVLRDTPSPQLAPELVKAEPATNEKTNEKTIYRGPFLDALQLNDPDRIALLQPEPNGGTTLRIIAGIGPALWRAASGATTDQLIEAATDTFGTPEGIDIPAAVDTALDELVTEGVLASEPVWRIREDVAFTGEGERYVALALSDLMNPTPLALQGTAATIWAALAKAREITATSLVETIADSLGLTPTDVDHDVREFLTTLQAQLLVDTIN